MRSKCWILSFAAVLLLAASALAAESPANLSAISNPWEVDLMLRSTIYLPTPRPVQDVFIVLNDTTPNQVYRIERNQVDDPINLAKEVYATTNATPKDPYKITQRPLGPFPKGADLGFTLGQWLAAIGTGTYTEENDSAMLNITFRNLVPNGTYTVWYARVTVPPNFSEELTPIGASDGSQNMFKADASGNATFNLTPKALPPSTNITYNDWVAMYVTKKVPITANVTWTLISVVYHSDGKSHGATPGEFGKTTHGQMVHLMYPKPARTYEAWKNATVVDAAAQAEKMNANATTNATANATAPAPNPAEPGFEGIFALTGLLAIGYIVLGRNK